MKAREPLSTDKPIEKLGADDKLIQRSGQILSGLVKSLNRFQVDRHPENLQKRLSATSDFLELREYTLLRLCNRLRSPETLLEETRNPVDVKTISNNLGLSVTDTIEILEFRNAL